MENYKVYIHKVNTENGPLYYAGVTRRKLYERWKPSEYKETALYDYIIQYGWKTIEHTVVFETCDREKALQIEDMLICGYAALGRNINKQRSGLIYVSSDKNTYFRQLLNNNPEYAERYYKRKRQHNRQYRRNRYATDPEFVERQRQSNRQYRRNKLDTNPEYAERKRQRERDRYANDPEYAERRCKYQRERKANDPEWAERERERKRKYNCKRRSTPEGKIYNRVSNFNHQHPDKAVETPMEAKRKYLATGYIPTYIKNDDLK